LGKELCRIRSTERLDTATDAARNPAPVSSRPNCRIERSHDGCCGAITGDVLCGVAEIVGGVGVADGIETSADGLSWPSEVSWLFWGIDPLSEPGIPSHELTKEARMGIFFLSRSAKFYLVAVFVTDNCARNTKLLNAHCYLYLSFLILGK
jgi:hypothetical protein